MEISGARGREGNETQRGRVPAPAGFATGGLQNPGAGWHPGCWQGAGPHQHTPVLAAPWFPAPKTKAGLSPCLHGPSLPAPDGGCPLRVAVSKARRRSKRISRRSAIPVPASSPGYGAGSEPSSCLPAFIASQWEKSIFKVIKESKRPRAARHGACDLCRSGVAKPWSIPREKLPPGLHRAGFGPPP